MYFDYETCASCGWDKVYDGPCYNCEDNNDSTQTLVHQLVSSTAPDYNEHGTDVMTQRTREYMVKMYAGKLGGPGEGVYYAQCRKCAYRSMRYPWPHGAETDVQEHLWYKHAKATFLVEVKV